MNRNDIVEALKSKSDNILLLADKIRKENVGNKVLLRGLIEFSNYCNRNCLYCGIRFDNKKCVRYRLSKVDIIKYAQNAIDLGLKTIVLQSGEDFFYKKEDLIEIITEIKKYDVALTLSIGERPYEEYRAFKDAGADRFLMRIETSNKKLYEKLHPNSSYEKRVESILKLKELGYELGTGCLVGVLGQDIEMLADDILFFKDVGADMVGLGPFLVNSNTPLQNEKNGSFELALRVLALVRIMLPKANIPATTAMETIRENGRIMALQVGANVVMPNVVDYDVNKNYNLYENKVSNKFGIRETLENIKSEIVSIGRIPE